jgi:hypothetical protein
VWQNDRDSRMDGKEKQSVGGWVGRGNGGRWEVFTCVIRDLFM